MVILSSHRADSDVVINKFVNDSESGGALWARKNSNLDVCPSPRLFVCYHEAMKLHSCNPIERASFTYRITLSNRAITQKVVARASRKHFNVLSTA